MGTTIPFYSGAKACCIDLFVYIISNSHKNSNNQTKIFFICFRHNTANADDVKKTKKKQNKMKQPPSPVRQINTGLIQGL